MKSFSAAAKLVAWDVVRVIAPGAVPGERLSFDFLIDGEARGSLGPASGTSRGGATYYDLKLEEPIELGHDYALRNSLFGTLKLDVSGAPQFPDFDDKFAYCGDDLGASYHRDHTDFALWAPLASSVLLRAEEDGKRRYFEMERTERGVYRLRLEGDKAGLCYRYVVTNSGTAKTAIDPYGKSSTLNAGASVVVDLARLEIDPFDERLPKFGSLTEAIIYECSVRDISAHPATDIVHKGKFLGMIEKGRRSKGGNPVGYDYLRSLGISHLQLLPVLDFANVDEADPAKAYNWGYDPKQYFTLEGSYAEDPSDPLSRIRDFKKLVREYHKAGIRIVLDVVYNHVYDAESSTFEKIVPNYYFRLGKDGKRTAFSGCGDDLATERKMVRKMIVDSVSFLFDTYHIDGLRFDLMSLIDAETIRECVRAGRKVKPDAVFYGEGWSMGAAAGDGSPLASVANASLVPGVAFFNDGYRNAARGVGGKPALDKPGYLMGNRDLLRNFEEAWTASTIGRVESARYKNAARSINYVECHDDGTLMDYLSATRPAESEHVLEERLLLANKMLLLSFGVPFFHMGQEFGMSKSYHLNTYNEGDKYNRFDVELYDRKQDLVERFRSYVRMRRRFAFLYEKDPKVIDRISRLEELDGSLAITIRPEGEKPRELLIFLNPFARNLYPRLGGDYHVYVTNGNGAKDGALLSNPIIGPIAATILYR